MKTSSTLLSLPIEIRTHIFVLAFSLRFNDWEPVKHSIVQKVGCLGLLLSCRQIYQETRVLAYQVNEIFGPVSFGTNTGSTFSFIQRLTPSQRRAIRKINFRLWRGASDEAQAARILCTLFERSSDEFSSPSSITCWPQRSDLRAISLTITSRPVMIPGISQHLEPKNVFAIYESPILKALAAFPMLSKVSVTFELPYLTYVNNEDQMDIRAQTLQVLPASVTDFTLKFKVHHTFHRRVTLSPI